MWFCPFSDDLYFVTSCRNISRKKRLYRLLMWRPEARHVADKSYGCCWRSIHYIGWRHNTKKIKCERRAHAKKFAACHNSSQNHSGVSSDCHTHAHIAPHSQNAREGQLRVRGGDAGRLLDRMHTALPKSQKHVLQTTCRLLKVPGLTR